MKKRSSELVKGTAAIGLSAILWGFDGVVLTPRLHGLNVAYVVLMLHLIPFGLMNIFMFKEYKQLKNFLRQDYITFTLIALFGGAVGTMAIVKALFLVNFQNLSVVVLLQKLQPIFAISLAAILLKEKLKKNFAIWATVAIIGSYFLTFGLNVPNVHTDKNTIYAALLAILAAFSFGSSTVFSKKVLMNFNFATATFYRYGFTTVLMLIYVVIFGKYTEIVHTDKLQWGLFVLIGLTTGSGAIFIYYYGLRRVRAMVATISELLFPISAIFFDYIVNGSVLSPVQMVSAVVMIFAMLMLSD
jgi:drug/metabolite transporter (DMT)-like permease